LTPAAARAAIEHSFAAAADEPIAITAADTRYTVSADSIGARLDATASVAAAMAVGRTGDTLQAAWQRVTATFSGAEVTPTVGLEPGAGDDALDRIDAATELAPRDAKVSVKGTVVRVTAARYGRALDRASTRAAIAVAIMSGRSSAAAVIATVVPDVTDAAAEAARQQAVKLISGPVTVTFEGEPITVPRATVATWVSFSQDTTPPAGTTPASPGGLTVSFSAKRIAGEVASLTEGRARPGKPAKFVVTGRKVRVTPSQIGTGPDIATLAADLVRACLGPASRTAEVRLTQAQPSLTTEAAKAMAITHRLSTYTTHYATVNPSRTHNIHVLAKALDGKLVAPGAVFSFNGAAGQRTAAKGYQEAPAIVKGMLVPQLGGGVCQVGTTIFNAVFFSGLPVVERRNHSFYISHYPTGRDATVSWGYPDFKFRNDTDHWILVHTSVTSSSLTVALYGTDPGYRVTYTTGPFTDMVKFKTVKTPDPTLAKGTTVVEDGGVSGRTVVVVRTVYKGDVVVRKDTFVSHYNPKTEFVRVGTKASSTPTGTVKP
jgi:vancomycin resistance protein YoaR